MAHYAFIDDTGLVVQVIAGRDENDLVDGVTSWENYYSNVKGLACVRTSRNTHGGVHYIEGEPSADQSKAFRKNYAGIGFTYDENLDAFIPPKPYDSWVLNEETCWWEAPIPYPENSEGIGYQWNESNQSWDEVPSS
jgi:hypothetical protein